MITSRHRAREAALQVLYLQEVGRLQPQAAIDAFFEVHQPDASEATRAFTGALVHGTAVGASDLDGVIQTHSEHWRVERLAVIDRLILRMAIWEMRQYPDTPRAVVLNEAIELARRFSTEESARFVNGVLDAARKTLEG